ncbi:hypothetical protein BCS42_02950 [Crenothrix sp. D3]|nr:hypothetical protein BCS42_02950 [Crenothrix sp. D3]
MKKAEIYYFTLSDELPREDKLAWFKNTRFTNIEFDKINPDDKGNWLNLTDNDFDNLMPVCDKEVKLGKKQGAIFKLFSLGVVTNRDEWVYDDSKVNLTKKIELFMNIYNSEIKRWGKAEKILNTNDFVDRAIKWTEELEGHLKKGNNLQFKDNNINLSTYRPYIKKYFYFDKIITHRIYQNDSIFGFESKYENLVICFSGQSSSKHFQCLAVNQLSGLDFLEKTQCLPLYVYDKDGNPHDNITDWALTQFQARYSESKVMSLDSTKEAIFHYVYAVLHNPAYREKYEQNLKREFPRIPFYDDFAQWADWGKALMALHLNYETVEKYPLKRLDTPPIAKPKAKLKADKINSVIQLDDNTRLSDIPLQAWEYKLGNRSALEWVLDQYKEKKPKDPTIAEKFNTYRFADYKEQVVELLMRVCTVSVETMKIIESMKKLS